MPCKICQSREHKVIRNKLRYGIKRDVLQCRKCGFVYLAAKDGSEFDFYSGNQYRKHYGPDLEKKSDCRQIFNIYLPVQDAIIKEFKHILRPNMKVLDIGCSTGHFLTAMKNYAGERVGLELGRDEVDFIRKNLDFKVYNAPIQEVDITERPFDLITAFQVLEHIDDPMSFLRAIGKNLKTGGYVYFELPNLNDVLISCYQVEGYIDFFYHEPHVSYFSAETLRRLMDRAGFAGEIKTVQRYSILNHISWILTGQPQKNFTLGNAAPELVRAGNVEPELKTALNGFIQKTDREYKQLINKHKLGESLTFLGTKAE